MEPALLIIVGIAVVVIAITGFSIYTAFGPPSVELTDQFEEHED
ncbi:MAG: photosystem II reaction center protein PsbN [Symploca sp. SIO1B1]|nr:photosystem II reaction center protein PsbN [Symploca sp. SIO2D2]NER20326.1 photosystem II reaction center protein PsbN [Symploca sp. SIO1C2]NER99873.1 photosystem II reaction center protein PsbN [Symploca sp. SIO1B1]